MFTQLQMSHLLSSFWTTLKTRNLTLDEAVSGGDDQSIEVFLWGYVTMQPVFSKMFKMGTAKTTREGYLRCVLYVQSWSYSPLFFAVLHTISCYTDHIIRGLDCITSRHPHALQWRHNERNGLSNHQPHDCILKRLFRCRSKKTSKHRVTVLCVGNSPVTGEFPAQLASNMENVSIWWRHHGVSGSK